METNQTNDSKLSFVTTKKKIKSPPKAVLFRKNKKCKKYLNQLPAVLERAHPINDRGRYSKCPIHKKEKRNVTYFGGK